MNKICRVVIVLLAMAGSSSCFGKVRYCEYEPTHSFRGTANKMKTRSFKKSAEMYRQWYCLCSRFCRNNSTLSTSIFFDIL